MSRGLGIMIMALILLCHVPAMSQDDFEVAVTNALARRSRLVDPMFTNYLAQCTGQNTNEQMALSATIIQGFSQIEMYSKTMDQACISNAFSSISNAQLSSVLTTNVWQYWHLQALNAICMNTDNNLHGAYVIASNAWQQIQAAAFVDSTNDISRALVRFYDVGEGSTIKDALAVMYALDAYEIGRTNEVNAIKPYMAIPARQKFESFLE